jgi:arylsulfatase A-like enzyme
MPNVVIIFMDDLGYADIGAFGAKGYSTPELDRMATEGRIFTDFYVSQAVCSASRASLLTGCYNVRVGIFGALGPASQVGIHNQEMTLAEVFKQKGYATACIGKWHLGHHPKFLPTRHGFDEYFGLPYSNDMWPYHPTAGDRFPPLPLFQGEEVVDPEVTAEDQKLLTRRYTEQAVDFIRRNRNKPFFVYLAHAMVHVPLFCSADFEGKTGRGLFADVMAEVDWSVGQILQTIRQLGLEKQTWVIFSSDNGPWLSYGDHAGSAGPLREGKGTTFEGGVRVPTVMWWPGTIPAGTVCREPAMTIDLLPTIAARIGAKLPEHPIDGKDIWPLVVGEPGARSPHQALFFYWNRELQAVRMGKWKLHFPHSYQTLAGRQGGSGGKPVAYQQAKIDLSLFDLESDVGETTNVADQHPEVVQQIVRLAESIRAELGDSATKQSGTATRPTGQLLPGDPYFDWPPGKPLVIQPVPFTPKKQQE